MIDPTFSPTQQQAIKDQLAKWKNAGGANVTFNVVEPSAAGPGACCGGRPVYAIMCQVPTNYGAGAQGETRGFVNVRALVVVGALRYHLALHLPGTAARRSSERNDHLALHENPHAPRGVALRAARRGFAFRARGLRAVSEYGFDDRRRRRPERRRRA